MESTQSLPSFIKHLTGKHLTGKHLTNNWHDLSTQFFPMIVGCFKMKHNLIQKWSLISYINVNFRYYLWSHTINLIAILYACNLFAAIILLQERLKNIAYWCSCSLVISFLIIVAMPKQGKDALLMDTGVDFLGCRNGNYYIKTNWKMIIDNFIKILIPMLKHLAKYH